MIESEYYSFFYHGELSFGIFKRSIENPCAYIVERLRVLQKIVNRSACTYQIFGMEELFICGESIHVDIGITKIEISIVSKSYYIRKILPPYQEGMTNLYIIEGGEDKFPPSNIHLGENAIQILNLMNRQLFIDIEFEKTIGRFNLQEAFMKSLRQSKGQGRSVSFSLDQVSIIFINYLFNGISNSSSFVSLQTTSRTKAVLKIDSILSEILVKTEIILQCPSVEWLIPFFGNNFYYFPIVNRKRSIGSLENERFAFIKIHDSEIIFKFDINSRRYFLIKHLYCFKKHHIKTYISYRLQVSYALENGNKDEATNGLSVLHDELNAQIVRLTGKIVRADDVDYRVCLVEYNSIHFTQLQNRNKYTNTMVAWSMISDDFVEECIREECFPLDPFSIEDVNIHDFDEPPLNKRSDTLVKGQNAPIFLGADYSIMSTNGKYVHDELKKCNGAITIADLCRALDFFSITEIKRILCDDLRLNVDLDIYTTKKNLMCLCQFVLENI